MFERNSRFLFTAMAAGSLVLAGCGGDDEPTPVAPPPPEPPPAPAAPSTPTNVQATLDMATHHVTVTWGAAANATTYTVERNLAGSGEGFGQLQSGISGTSYVDENAPFGTLQYRVIAVGAGGSSGASDPAEVVNEQMMAPMGTLSTRVGPGEIRTLSADTVYTLQGVVTVEDGGELHIPAGTHIQGSTEVQPSALIVRAGGKLFSEGTEDEPVVFTSSNPPEERSKGDWGGIVLNGRSLCNFPAGECVGEGSSGQYGGTDRNDNSGTIVYTRIEYAGFEVSFGNELNALTMNGVGDGTTIHHVQTHAGSDDGFEWFGGTVNTHHLLATDISDDSFDYSTGFQGMGQFWLAQQDPDDGDNGFEVDGNEDDYNAEPFTVPLLVNVTLIGKGMNGEGGTEGESVDGFRLRRGTGGHIVNALVIGFGGDGLDIDNDETVARMQAGLFSIRNSIIALNADAFEDAEEEAIFNTEGWGNRVGVDPMLGDPFDRVHPDFQPQAGSPALEGAASLVELAPLLATLPPELQQQFAAAATFFDLTAVYVGAVGPDHDWTQEHVDPLRRP